MGLVVIAMTMSTLSHAEQVPIVRMDASDCELRPWHNLGVCIQNKTGEEIQDTQLNYRQSIYYSDKRTKIVAIIPMINTRANRNIVISTSTSVLQKNSIKTVVNEIIIGKNIDGGTIPGCYFQINDHAVVSNLILTKTNGGYQC